MCFNSQYFPLPGTDKISPPPRQPEPGSGDLTLEDVVEKHNAAVLAISRALNDLNDRVATLENKTGG